MRRIPPEATALAIILGIALCSAIAVSIAAAGPKQQASVLPTLPPPTAVRSPTPVPAVFPGPLDGQPTPKRLGMRRPLAIMVDDFYPDARPEAGISQASVVYEAVIEGGVTRLMAVFLEHDATEVGPIRSARPYFVQWAAGYRALLLTAGGSPSALQLLSQTPQVATVDALQALSQFYRLPDRVAPHDLFSSTQGARTVAAQSGTAAPIQYQWMAHRAAANPGSGRAVKSIHIDFSTPIVSSPLQYAVTYRYRAHDTAYLRFVGGLPALDVNSNRQIEVRNVVVLYTTVTPVPNDGAGRMNVGTLGSGKSLYLRDGRVFHGTWSKRNTMDALQLWDAHHHRFLFASGNTWVEVVSPGAVRFGQ